VGIEKPVALAISSKVTGITGFLAGEANRKRFLFEVIVTENVFFVKKKETAWLMNLCELNRLTHELINHII